MEALCGAVELVGMRGKDGVWTGTLTTIWEERLGDLGKRRGQLLVVSGDCGLVRNGIGEGFTGRAVWVGGRAGSGDGWGRVDCVHGG